MFLVFTRWINLQVILNCTVYLIYVVRLFLFHCSFLGKTRLDRILCTVFHRVHVHTSRSMDWIHIFYSRKSKNQRLNKATLFFCSRTILCGKHYALSLICLLISTATATYRADSTFECLLSFVFVSLLVVPILYLFLYWAYRVESYSLAYALILVQYLQFIIQGLMITLFLLFRISHTWIHCLTSHYGFPMFFQPSLYRAACFIYRIINGF